MARRCAPEFNMFAAARDETPDAVAALAALSSAVGERLFLMQAPEIMAPAGMSAVLRAKAVQLVATRPVRDAAAYEGVVVLGEADAAEMLALAKLAEPGPFRQRTHEVGMFLGVRIEGRLAAMAGERFRFPGYTEISGVCTHPDFRGRGLARRLSTAVAAGIEARGDQPFLHAWGTNRPAIALYESLGFAPRTDVDVAVLESVG